MIGPKTKLILQQPSESSDGLGAGGTILWSNIKQISGTLNSIKGNEKLGASKKIIESSSHIFYCDPTLGFEITTEKRFILGIKKFDIVYISNPFNMNNHLEVYLLEVK